MGKYFGTDGIRGLVNQELDCALAFKTGQAAATVLSKYTGHKPVFYIGMDTRLSGAMLEAALSAGLCSMGADVCQLGIIPTPAVAYLTVKHRADAGIVISASHNPQQYNGIKIFGADGYKLNDALESSVEALIDDNAFSLAEPSRIGRITRRFDMAVEYCDHIYFSGDGTSLHGMKLLFDCANGAASETAGGIFLRTGADCDFLFKAPNGININDQCGSTHLETLSKEVVLGGYDAGIAFDGDADRCLIIDEHGRLVNGDRIIAVCGLDMQRRGILAHDTIVVTVLSNLALHEFCSRNGIQTAITPVGDRAVLEKMLEQGYSIGGEQSGHVIFSDCSTTGDGQLTAMRYLQLLRRSGKKASELSAEIVDFPQVMLNVPVDNSIKREIASLPAVASAVREAEKVLGSAGRVLVRPSGTEALVRVMVECRSAEEAQSLAEKIAAAMR